MKKGILILLLTMMALIMSSVSFAEEGYDLTDEVVIVPGQIVTSPSAIAVTPYNGYETIDNDYETESFMEDGESILYEFDKLQELTEVTIQYDYNSTEFAQYAFSYRVNGQWHDLESASALEGPNFIRFDVENAGQPLECDALRLIVFTNGSAPLIVREVEMYVVEDDQDEDNGPQTMLMSTEYANVNLGQALEIFVALEDVKSIGASDFSFEYDSTKLELVNVSGVNDHAVVYEGTSGSAVRVLVVSNNKDAFITGDEDVVKLTFNTIGEGNTSVALINAKIANLDTEYEIAQSLLGSIDLYIGQSVANDVNDDGQINLVDIALTAWFNGFAASSVPDAFSPDQNLDGMIDDTDLVSVLNMYLK